MSRLIDADKLNYIWLPLTAIPERFATETDVRNAPTIEAVEIVHAEWVEHTDGYGYFECSHCKADRIGIPLHYRMPYCFNCGAKMDGKDGDNK